METPRYQVRIDRQGAIRFTLELSGLDGASEVRLEVPTWVAGAYAFLRYGRDLFGLSATGGDGAPLLVERVGLSGLRVAAPDENPIDALYLSGTVQARDAAWGELAGICRDDGGIFLPTAFPVPAGWSDSVEMHLDAGEGREVLIAGVCEELRGGLRRFPSFEAWLDTPIVFGRPTVLVREVRGCRFEFVFCQRAIGFESEAESLVDEVARVVEACHALFGSFPFERYSFIVSFSPGDHWGLEHAHATMIAIGEDALIDEDARMAALRVAAHEIFHAWNVWRLRPEGFHVGSRTGGAFTDALWMCEGFTRYYEFIILARAGLIHPARVLENLVMCARHHAARPAYAHTTLVDSSLATFLNHTRWPGAWNATLDYYDGGMLVAFELDALLRTRYRSSLDEVFVAFFEAYANHRGFDTAAFERFLEKRAEGAGAWLARKVREPATLDLPGALQALGLEPERKPKARVGLVFEKGTLLVAQALEGSPAYEAGIAPGDELLAIDGLRASTKALGWIAQRARPFSVTVARGHVHRSFELRPRYVDELVAIRFSGSPSPAVCGMLGPKTASWGEGERIAVRHHDNFHGTEPIY